MHKTPAQIRPDTIPATLHGFPVIAAYISDDAWRVLIVTDEGDKVSNHIATDARIDRIYYISSHGKTAAERFEQSEYVAAWSRTFNATAIARQGN